MKTKLITITLVSLVTVLALVPLYLLNQADAQVPPAGEGGGGLPYPYSVIDTSARELARTSDGVLHAVYSRTDGSYSQIYHSYSNDGGKTWTEEQITTAFQNHRYPSIAADSNDRVHVAWSYCQEPPSPGNTCVVQYRVKTTTWQPIEDVITGYGSTLSLAVDSQNNVHLVVSGCSSGSCDEVKYMERTPSGWSSPEKVSTECWAGGFLAIAIDKNDNIHMVYRNAPLQAPLGGIRYREKTASGWGSEVVIEPNDSNASDPSIAIDSNNYVHIVWEWKNPNQDEWAIKYVKFTDSWQPIEILEGPTSYPQLTPSISIDSNDKVHVVWQGKHSDSPNYFQVRYKNYSGSWSTVQNLTSASIDQKNPNLIWAWWPIVNNFRTNIPKNGYAFLWNDGPEARFYKSSDLEFPAENQPPTLSGLGQFDGATSIPEGWILRHPYISSFSANISDPDGDQIQLQVELRRFEEPFTGNDDGGLLTSDFHNSGNIVRVPEMRDGIRLPIQLSDGKYHWRARAIDAVGNVSAWQEFGAAGNVDFEILTSQPPTCVIKLQKDGVEINEINVGEFFDIYVGSSTDNTGIKEVRFLSDETQDGSSTGEWTGWFSWDTSSGDWDHSTKIKKWSFATLGEKEVWAEVRDGSNTSMCSANISVVRPPVLLVHGFQFPDPLDPRDWADYKSGQWSFNPIEGWEEMSGVLTGIKKDEQVASIVPGHSFWKLEKRSEDGLTVYISKYSLSTKEPTLNDIRLYAYNLAEEIQAIKVNENVNRVDIVGHSMGGLVARAYIENDDFSDNPYGTVYKSDVRKLITLGTPNHGVELARIVCDHCYAITSPLLPIDECVEECLNSGSIQSVKQMIPQNTFLNFLNCGEENCTKEDYTEKEDKINPEVEYSTIAGTGDNLVTTESAGLDDTPYYAFPVDHTGLRTSDSVGDLVKNILSDQDITVNRVTGYAIIVAGKSSSGWWDLKGKLTDQAVTYNANNAYRVLRNLGFNDDHIFYLNSNRSQDIDDDGYDEVDAGSSLESFEEAIEWARQQVNEDTPFILYLIGHGLRDMFFFNEPEGDGIDSVHLNDLLETFPEETPVFNVLDTCFSGSFITSPSVLGTISIPNRNRVIVTSAHDDQKKWHEAISGRLFYSDDFWRNFDKGFNIKDTFVETGDNDYAWLDDNGDRIGHPPNFLENDGDLAENMWIGIPDTENIGLKPFAMLELFSPVDVQVYDSQRNTTGLVNGEIREEIPNSIYDTENKIVIIFEATDKYNYKVVGTDTGTYGLKITSNKTGETTIFTATDIPTTPGQIHQYTIDWDAFSQGENGVTLQIDADGDGIFEKTVTADNELTSDEFILQTETIIDFDPNTLNLKDKGKFVTTYIELPEGYEVSQIDIPSIMLNDLVPVLAKPTEIGDYDKDGTPDLMVKFDRSNVQAILSPGNEVLLILTGKVFYNGNYIDFKGSDIIRVIDSSKGKK